MQADYEDLRNKIEPIQSMLREEQLKNAALMQQLQQVGWVLVVMLCKKKSVRAACEQPSCRSGQGMNVLGAWVCLTSRPC